jgi:hypothetical protein
MTQQTDEFNDEQTTSSAMQSAMGCDGIPSSIPKDTSVKDKRKPISQHLLHHVMSRSASINKVNRTPSRRHNSAIDVIDSIKKERCRRGVSPRGTD